MELRDVESLLTAKSVAVIGASENIEKFGGRVISFLLSFGYKGKIYPVSRTCTSLFDMHCYSSLAEIGVEVDVVVIAVPAKYVPEILNEARSTPVKNAVIISSGFAERGEEGVLRQRLLVKQANDLGIRILGPNCLGMIKTHTGLVLSSTQALLGKQLKTGEVSIVSQSGAVAGSILSNLRDYGVGINSWISTGNEADYEMSEFVDYLVDDPQTKVIGLYIEGIRNAKRFKNALFKANQAGKPVVALKIGRSHKGAAVASSHTAAVTGDDANYQALFQQSGVVRVNTIEEMVQVLSLFDRFGKPKQNGTFVITSSGGLAGIIADKAEDIGLELTEPTSKTASSLKEVMKLPTVNNPLDFGGGVISSLDDFRGWLDIIARDPEIGSVIVALTTMPVIERVAQQVADFGGENRLPVIYLSTAGGSGEKAAAITSENQIPTFNSTLECLNAVMKWQTYKKGLEKNELEGKAVKNSSKELIQSYIKEGRVNIGEKDTKKILSTYGIPVVKEYLAKTAGEATVAANEIGYPVVIKIASDDILHKTEAKGVKTNISSDVELLNAFETMLADARNYNSHARIDGILIQPMIDKAVEVFVGVKSGEFGPMVVVGLGGIFVELMKDVAIRAVPVTLEETFNMLEELKAAPILKGYRNKVNYDTEALRNTLVKVSLMAKDLEEVLLELDINPLMVCRKGKGVVAVDGVMILQGSR